MYIEKILRKIKNSTTLKSGIWYLITGFFLRGMAFITVPIYTRLLTVKDYGLISVYTTFVGIFAIISGLNLYAPIGTGINDFKENKKEYLSSTLFLSFISFSLLFFSIYLFRSYFVKLFNIQENILILAVISGYLSFVFSFAIKIKVFEKNYKKKSLLTVINAFLNIGLSISFLLILKNNYIGRIYGDLLSKLLLSSMLFFIIILNGKKLIWLKAWKYSLLIGVPLILHSLSGIMLSQFDRLAIQKFIGSFDVGLYSYAYTLGMIPLIVLGATNLAWVPWFYDMMYKKDISKIQSRIKEYNDMFVILLMIISILTPELGVIMAPRKYTSALIIIPIIIVSYYMQFLYTLYVNFAFFYKKTFSISLGTLFAGLINIVLNIWLIPLYGYEIAAMTTLISYCFLLFFHIINVRYNLKDKTIATKYIIIWALFLIILSLVQYFTAKYFGMFSCIERIVRIIIFGSTGIFVSINFYKKAKIYKL